MYNKPCQQPYYIHIPGNNLPGPGFYHLNGNFFTCGKYCIVNLCNRATCMGNFIKIREHGTKGTAKILFNQGFYFSKRYGRSAILKLFKLRDILFRKNISSQAKYLTYLDKSWPQLFQCKSYSLRLGKPPNLCQCSMFE